MEATQRLECTQELYETNTERVCPEQIGFLGICGAKHPVLRGPNKIGRDPQTCNIILNLNSVSRQHAVINVLNSKEFMLMDLDSANKTKLLNKTLKPYIPHPLRNGDTVQFGDIFGIFRLLEENDDLPMTQAIDVPETPVQSRYMSKIKVHTTVIPESPDASDRDDSIISQAHMTNEKTRLSSGQFITPFGKKLSIQPISLPKTDTSTVSSRQSSSSVNHNISLDETFNHSKKNKNIDNIHEMNTQAPNPTVNDSTDSIYTADTQIPLGHGVSSSIHSLDTQIPTTENLPQVRKIEDIEEMQFDLYAANKENDLSIFNAETQPFLCEKDESLDNKSKLSDKELNVCSKPIKHLNKSDEDILFDDIDDECLDDFDSQPLLPLECSIRRLPDSKPELKNPNSSDNPMDSDDIDIIPTQKVEEISFEILSKEPKSVCPTASRRNNRINSDSSTDCDDIESMATQKIPELLIANDITQHKDTKKTAAKRAIRIQSDSSTDCEDINIMPTQKISDKKEIKEKNITDCEDDIKINSKSVSQEVDVVRFENLSAKIVDHDPDKIVKPSLEEMNTQIISIDENAPTKSTNDDSFENQPTQIIDEIIPNNMEANEKPFKEISSPFKIPLKSPLKVKTKEFSKVMIPKDEKAESKSSDHDPNYYNTTQDILDDLCTQRNGSPVLIIVPEKSKSTRSSTSIEKDEIVPCSVEDYKVGAKFANIDRDLSPAESCGKQATKTFAADLSTQEVRHIIGAEVSVDKPKKFPSDSSSDVECTPKKERHFLFTDSDLPNSQEIQNNVIVKHKSLTIESSSESEPEANTEDQFTPIVHKKKKPKTVAKVDLTKRFDVEKLPERIITRVRKPTSKMEEWSSKADKNASTNLLRAKFLTEQEDQIDEDIIIENVKRLKSYGKAKSRKDAKNDTKTEDDITGKEFEHDKSRTISKEIKNEDNSENNGMNSKEKIKVKIEKPKRKESIKHKKSKDKEESSREDHGQLNTNKNKEKAPDVKNTEDANQKKQNDENKPEVSLQSISDCKTSSSTKNTRTRRTVTDKKTTEKQSKSPDNIEKVDYKRKRSTRKREQPKKSTSPAVEIRRSRRHAKAKENKSDSQERQTTQAPISILKKSVHEQSSVYNLSTSGGESPKNLKRSLADDNDLPSPKKTKGFVNNMNINSNNVSLRATPARTMKTHVLFTAFPCGDANHKLEKLGTNGSTLVLYGHSILVPNVVSQNIKCYKSISVQDNCCVLLLEIHLIIKENAENYPNRLRRQYDGSFKRGYPKLTLKTIWWPLQTRCAVVVTNVLECNVVLTMQVKRTFKLLCAVGLGCPIVGASWVQACIDMHTIVDPWLYLIKDEPAEKRFQFNLERSLKGKRNFLKGYNVSSTPSVLPNASEMKLIVECSGGVWKEGGCNWVCVSSTKDQALWPSLRHRGATIVTTEFILGGVLKQKIEINANKFP